MAALPPVSVPIIAPSRAPSLAPASASYNSTSPYLSSQSPGASPASAPDGSGQSSGQPVGSGQALLSLSPVTTVEVLLICISGAVILHFVTRYLYLRAHRQLMSDGRQQQQQQPTSNVNSSSHRNPDAQPSSAVEMHSAKPTVIVVQPDEEVCCGVEEDARDGSGAQQQTGDGQGSHNKPEH
ncbi:hypothetical protein CVIRNUC_009139 [Coccomyxa viridis]|uniref:Uncharacterized protein n=1 Tax=Coccomyxa viridis TaxID=1274662 RepID=A0AAV1IEZ1_9CHLO|nr:hypothetical protein CVIRNUC_009139 [Coccomyxa viridis]